MCHCLNSRVFFLFSTPSYCARLHPSSYAAIPIEEDMVWGKTRSPEYLAKHSAHTAPMVEHPAFSAAGKGLVESGAIMQFFCNLLAKVGARPGSRAGPHTCQDGQHLWLAGRPGRRAVGALETHLTPL